MNSKASSNITKTDRRYMAAAIRYARQNEGQTASNPSVACVIVASIKGEDHIIGAGVTAKGGRPHAEPIALKDVNDNGFEKQLKGATAYVTLEPCAHHGRTPPCASTLIEAGIARVVTAYIDPDSRVNQQGHAMLQDAGIQVDIDCLSDDAKIGLNAYLTSKVKRRAHVTLKLATSQDGYMGAKDKELGKRQVKITGETANSQTHLLRARHHAILVGAQTILDDDPNLTCRLNGLEDRSPIRIILDPNGRVPLDAKIIQSAHQVRTLIVAPHDMDASRRDALKQNGVNILSCQIFEGAISLPELLEDIASLGIQSILVEGGAKTAAAFLQAKLVDELILIKGKGKLENSYKELVVAPINTDNAAQMLGEEFRLQNQLQLGEDRLKHYIRS